MTTTDLLNFIAAEATAIAIVLLLLYRRSRRSRRITPRTIYVPAMPLPEIHQDQDCTGDVEPKIIGELKAISIAAHKACRTDWRLRPPAERWRDNRPTFKREA